MVRKLRVFTREQTAAMVELFDEGEPIARIGERNRCSFYVARRVLNAELGNLRIARAMSKARRSSQTPPATIRQQLGEQKTSQEYREGFEAGYRMALTHVNLHGLEQAREHCNTKLLPWRDRYENSPPVFGAVTHR